MKTYLVGGAVRDQLLHFPYHEKDWVVIDSSPEEMTQLGYIPVGKDFPVFLHPHTHEEYALARTERKTAPGYKGFTFHTDKNVTLEDDLQRRDLTINAIAQAEDGTLIDPYHGQQDIADKYLRHVSSAFSEDPVRVLRVARFAARYHHLGFRVAEETLVLMKAMVKREETKHLVAERVWQETQKALTEKHPEIFFRTLIECQAADDIFPAITLSTAQLLPLMSSAQYSSDPIVRFAAFCQPFDCEEIATLCQQLNAPNEYRDLALLSKQYYATCTSPHTWTTDSLTELFQKTDALRKPERFQQLLTSCTGIKSAENKNDRLEDEKIRKDLLALLHLYSDIDHQALIEQGFQKSALGQAILQQRKRQLDNGLKNHSIQH